MKNKIIKRKNFFPAVYIDEETKILSKEYDVTTCPDYPVPSSLGQYELEIGAQKLLSISKYFGEFVGVSEEDINKTPYEDFDSFMYIYYLDNKYARTVKKSKLEIIFPTEELLINQGIKKNR